MCNKGINQVVWLSIFKSWGLVRWRKTKPAQLLLHSILLFGKGENEKGETIWRQSLVHSVVEKSNQGMGNSDGQMLEPAKPSSIK